jgi:hypothetical protein
MKKLLANLALAGLIAGGALSLGTATASAQCARGSTDCPMVQPNGRGNHDWRRDRDDNRHWNRNDRGDRNDRWRHRDRDRDHRWRRHHSRNNGGSYFGFYYGTPSYRYVEPAPVYRYRYRANALPSAHIDWCSRHYRTYRLSDNTFKPTRNTRSECVSPYWP